MIRDYAATADLFYNKYGVRLVTFAVYKEKDGDVTCHMYVNLI